MKTFYLCIFAIFIGTLTWAEEYSDLQKVIAGKHRSDVHKARDKYRHPLQTLAFFGIKSHMKVVEIWPGSKGWYMEILAPYLRDKGQYIAAGFDLKATGFFGRANKQFRAKLQASPNIYDKVKVTELAFPKKLNIAPKESVDMVLTFRNVHNWMWNKGEQHAFNAFYKALKPGGILGVVEHRAKADTKDTLAKSGYVTEAYVKKLAKLAGFEFVTSSDINNNPRDTKDYKTGVWTLPPTLRLKEKDKEKYLAIGESDRFTLKFRKPLLK